MTTKRTAKTVNEMQNFTRGGDPYKKMKVGKYSSIEEMGAWAVEQLSGYGILSKLNIIEMIGFNRVDIILYDDSAKFSITYDKENNWNFWVHQTVRKFKSWDELLYNVIEQKHTLSDIITKKIPDMETKIQNLKKCKKYLEDNIF